METRDNAFTQVYQNDGSSRSANENWRCSALDPVRLENNKRKKKQTKRNTTVKFLKSRALTKEMSKEVTLIWNP